MDQRGRFLVAIFFVLLAVAFTGGERESIGFAKECIDNQDNDADGFTDHSDTDCRSYPYADGLGDTFTQVGADYNGEYYSVSMFDYDYVYGNNAGDDGYFCSTYPQLIQQYQNIENYSNGKDRAAYDYEYWYNQNCP